MNAEHQELLKNLDINACYVKNVVIGHKPCCQIHAADGTLLTVVDSMDLAFATAWCHDMIPMRVH